VCDAMRVSCNAKNLSAAEVTDNRLAHRSQEQAAPIPRLCASLFLSPPLMPPTTASVPRLWAGRTHIVAVREPSTASRDMS